MSYDKKFKERILAHIQEGHTQDPLGQEALEKLKKTIVYRERDEKRREAFRETVFQIPKEALVYVEETEIDQ